MRIALLLSCCSAFVGAQAIAEPVTFPNDHPSSSLRGLTVDDGPTGVIVTEGNDRFKSGDRFTHVNDQEVRTARELSLLVASSVASGTLSLKSKPGGSQAGPATATIKPKDWARALIFSDTPNGVIIDYSLESKEIGGRFDKFNAEPIASAADLKAKLATFVASPPQGYSTTITFIGPQGVSAGQERSDSMAAVVPSIEYKDATRQPRKLMLRSAINEEPPRPSAGDTINFARAWGPLAVMAGKIYAGTPYDDTCEKAAMGNTCYALIWWHKPGEILARSWFADRGYLVAADTILPTGKPGVFAVHRWVPQGSKTSGFGEVGVHHIRVSPTSVSELGSTLALSQSGPIAGAPHDDPIVIALMGTVAGRFRTLVSTSRAEALGTAEAIVRGIREANEADRQAQLERQRNDSMSQLYGVLTGVGQAIDHQNQQQQQQFENQMRSIPNNSPSSGGSSGGAIIVENLPPAPTYSPSPPSTVVQSPPPPTYTNPTPTDTCKRRVPYNYGVYKDLPYREGTRCLDAATVSGQ